MKAFSGGQLLDARTSPFGRALTEYQCIQYALDKPGVLTVLPGVRNRKDLDRLLGFLDASPEERDYSVLGAFTPVTPPGCASTATTASPARRVWTWASSTNTTTWPGRETSWPGITTPIWTSTPGTAFSAATATAAVLST